MPDPLGALGQQLFLQALQPDILTVLVLNLWFANVWFQPQAPPLTLQNLLNLVDLLWPVHTRPCRKLLNGGIHALRDKIKPHSMPLASPMLMSKPLSIAWKSCLHTDPSTGISSPTHSPVWTDFCNAPVQLALPLGLAAQLNFVQINMALLVRVWLRDNCRRLIVLAFVQFAMGSTTFIFGEWPPYNRFFPEANGGPSARFLQAILQFVAFAASDAVPVREFCQSLPDSCSMPVCQCQFPI